MTNHRVGFPSVAKICARFKQLCDAVARRVRLYGEGFTAVPDPMYSIQWGCSSDDEKRTHSLATSSRDYASARKKGGCDGWPPSVLREP
jgi:hypothetical protein